MYGSTEVSADATCHVISPRDASSLLIPVGIPIDNCTVLVLDEDKNQVFDGEVGEVHITNINPYRNCI